MAEVDLVLIQPFRLSGGNHVVLILTSKYIFPLENKGGLYPNKVNLSLTFTQRLGYKVLHNCKMVDSPSILILYLRDLSNVV